MNLNDLFMKIGGAGLVVFSIIGVAVVCGIVAVAMAIGPR